jgi:hypothetical protein
MRRYEHLASDLTSPIELGERDNAFVRRDLKNRVGGRIQNPRTRSLVLWSVLVQHRGPPPARFPITPPGAPSKLLDEPGKAAR